MALDARGACVRAPSVFRASSLWAWMPVLFLPRWLPVLLLCATVAACRDARPASAAAETIDDFGAALPTGRAYSRIVALEPATTEILFAIGAGDRLVGRTRYDLYPDSARLVPDLGEGIRPNVEALVAARPDLVVLYAGEDNRPARDRLTALGIHVVGFRSDRIAGFERITMALGQLVGDTARARSVVDSVTATLAAVRAATEGRERPTVLMPVWYNPLYVIGGASFMSELVDVAGGRNVYDDIAAPSPAVTFEDVVRRDPDVVLVAPAGRARVETTPQWRVLRAVREGRVLAYDTLVTGRPGVRLGEAAVSLARLLHPDVVVPQR